MDKQESSKFDATQNCANFVLEKSRFSAFAICPFFKLRRTNNLQNQKLE
jgi:hypothetical protein